MHWQPDEGDQALQVFLQRLLRLRAHLAGLFNPELPLDDRPQRRSGDRGHLWRQWHGVELGKPDWASWSHTLAWSLHDQKNTPLIWCGLNAYADDLSFELPDCPTGWLRVIDTARPPGEDLPAQPAALSSDRMPMTSRSLVLLVAEPLMRGHDLARHGL